MTEDPPATQRPEAAPWGDDGTAVESASQPGTRGQSGAASPGPAQLAPCPPAPEPASFEALFRAEFATMFKLAHLLGAVDPEDVAQEAFARLHSKWGTLAERTAAGGYLRTTVVNLVRSAARRRSVEIRHRAARAPDEPSASAESAALASVSDAALLAAVGSLSQRHREALVLRFWLDASERQIADAMGTSTGTAKSHVSRGLKALRAVLHDSREGGETA